MGIARLKPGGSLVKNAPRAAPIAEGDYRILRMNPVIICGALAGAMTVDAAVRRDKTTARPPLM